MAGDKKPVGSQELNRKPKPLFRVFVHSSVKNMCVVLCSRAELLRDGQVDLRDGFVKELSTRLPPKRTLENLLNGGCLQRT